MKFKSILAAAVVSACAFAGSVQASPVWTVTTHGTISVGNDYTGVFGPIGSLAGAQFTQTLAASVDPSLYNTVTNGAHAATLSGSTAGFTNTVTVNGTTLSVAVPVGVYAYQYLSDNANGNDDVIAYDEGLDVMNNQYVVSLIDVYTYSQNSYVTSMDFGQTIDQAVGAGFYYTNYFKWGDSVAFYGIVDHITVNGSAAVPEPASIALLALGLLGIGALRRRKSS